MMARILNVSKIIDSLAVPKDSIGSSLVLYIKDNFMELNDVLTKLKFTANGIVRVDTIDVPDITMDIATLTQLYFGTFSIADLVQNGKILVEKPQVLALLQKLFPQHKNFINEYF